MKFGRILLLIISEIFIIGGLSPVYSQVDRDKLLEEYLKREDSIKNAQALEASRLEEMMRGNVPGADYTTPIEFKDTLLTPVPRTEDTLKNDTAVAPRSKESGLVPFGFDLFDMPSPLTMPSEVADIKDYILGPGDNIIVFLWGKVEKQFNLTIDREGKVFVPKVGEIIAWGMTLGQFQEKIKEKLSRVYTDFQLSVSLGKIRSIRIYITGEVKKPGSYTVSSLATLFNAMYLAGGPNIRGSMRNVRLIREGEVEREVDLYDFLLKGDSRDDIRLSSGDAIFVPVTGPRVTVKGEIMRPGIYELKAGERVSDLIELAGGPLPTTYLDRIMLERIAPDNDRIVMDLNMNPETTDEPDNVELQNGDILTLYSIYDMKRNVVMIAGMVKHPQQFERTDSTTLKDLIVQGELLPMNVYYDRANLFRRNRDGRLEIVPIDLNEILSGEKDMLLRDFDSLHVYSVDEVERKKFVYIDGEVREPGTYLLYDNMSAADLIFVAGGLKKNAYELHAELARTDAAGQVTVRRIKLDNEETGTLTLQEDDRIFIRKIPDYFLNQLVTIEGEVRFPGRYALMSRNETLYDLIERSGGFTQRAFPKGIIFQRKSIGEGLIRQNLPQIIANSQPIREDSLGNIKKLTFVKFNPENVNRIIIDIDKLVGTDGREGDIALQSDDYVYVPEIPSGISVMGAVGAEGTIKFEPKKRVRYYIQRAGNFNRQADRSNVRLIKADGQVYAGRSTLRKSVELGDAIVVPTEIKKDRDVLKTISTVVSIVGGILTTVFVIDKI